MMLNITILVVRGVISYGSGSNTVEIITVAGDGDALRLILMVMLTQLKLRLMLAPPTALRAVVSSRQVQIPNENEFTFYYAVGGDSDGEFLGGKDTFDFGAQVNIFNADWEVTTSVDESALLAKLDLGAVDTTGIPQGFLDAILDGDLKMLYRLQRKLLNGVVVLRRHMSLVVLFLVTQRRTLMMMVRAVRVPIQVIMIPTTIMLVTAIRQLWRLGF